MFGVLCGDYRKSNDMAQISSLRFEINFELRGKFCIWYRFLVGNNISCGKIKKNLSEHLIPMDVDVERMKSRPLSYILCSDKKKNENLHHHVEFQHFS